MFLVSFGPIHWSQVLSWEWSCIWSTVHRRCSNYIWVINNIIAYLGATYIGGLTVIANVATNNVQWNIKQNIKLFTKKNAFENVISKISTIFSCDQAALWMVFSVCPSVCLSVTPFWLCSHHRIIMKFSEVITKDQGKVHAKGQGQRSKVRVTEVMTKLSRFRTLAPVWIHIWWWNDTYSLMLLRRGALLFLKVIRQISRSHGSKNRRIWPRLGVSGL